MPYLTRCHTISLRLTTSLYDTNAGMAGCHPSSPEPRAPFHGHRGHPHAVREGRRRPSDPPRGYQRALHGRWTQGKSH
jgi:hypothetical protein